MKVLSFNNLDLGHSATLADRQLFLGLAEKGVDLTVITHHETPESLSLSGKGIKVIHFPIHKKIDFNAIRKIRQVLSSGEYDLMHLTYSKAITNGLIATRGTNIRITAYLGSLSLYWHDPTAYLSFLNRRINRLICLSDGVEKNAVKQSLGRLRGKTVRIYKGYNPEWFSDIKPADRRGINVPEDGLLICCIANVRKIKGIPYLIKATHYLSGGLPLYFLMIGPGMDSLTVKKQIEGSPYRDNFRVMGFTENVLSYTSICDLYIQPSVTEGLGRSVIEAMCLGKPVIVSGKGGVEELISEGMNGYFVPSKSPGSIAEKIEMCYENREQLPEMGRRAIERIKSDFSPEKMIESTYKVFKDLTEEEQARIRI
jgi:L-malate glycosyltransferase